MPGSTIQHNTEARRAFLEGRSLSRRPRPVVWSSWQRSLAWSVDSRLLGVDYVESFPLDTHLLEAAESVLGPLIHRFDAAGVAFILADATGRITGRWTAERKLIKMLEGVNAAVGHTYAEDVVGTNAIGTVIEVGQTVHLDAQEHFSEAFHGFSCIGVPLREQKTGRLRGVLDVTVRAGQNGELAALLAEHVAEKIMNRLHEEVDHQDRALLQHFTRERHRSVGIAAIGPRTLMADPRATRLLSTLDAAELRDFAKTALQSTETLQKTFEGVGGHSLNARARTITEGHEPIGVLVRFQESPPSEALKCPQALPLDAYACDHLVGRSAAFLSSVARAKAAFEEGSVAIRGERGSGRQSLAIDLHRHAGMTDIRLLDTERGAVGFSDDWRARLGALADAPPAAMVFRNADRVPPECTDAVVDGLQKLRSCGWKIVFTVSSTATPETSVLAGTGSTIVDLPDLDSREGDLALLANAFASPKRLSTDAHVLLGRMVWTRDVAQLRSVVELLCRRATGMLVTPDDFTPELLEQAARRQLSRLERMELRMILQALAECGGNRQDAADSIGISRSTLYRKLRHAGMNIDYADV